MEELQTSTGIEKVIKGAKLNLYTTLLILPIFLISLFPFALFYGFTNVYIEIKTLLTPLFIILLASGVLVHEVLHALTWMALLKKGFSVIKFGFNIQSFSPYTHCTVPMQIWQYRLGGIAPGILMGFLPVALSFILESVLLNFIGFLFLWAASGDFISLFILRKLKRDIEVIDHPKEMGYIIISE